MIRIVAITERAKKDLRYIPARALDKFEVWVHLVESIGLEETRKISGFHDEPLQGKRKGQRSIRLNRAYRAIYLVNKDAIEFVSVEEVSKHDY